MFISQDIIQVVLEIECVSKQFLVLKCMDKKLEYMQFKMLQVWDDYGICIFSDFQKKKKKKKAVHVFC